MKAIAVHKRWQWLGLAIAASIVTAACGGGGGNGGTTTGQGMGTLRVALTDAPACGFDQVNVTVDRVRVHASASADEASGGWHDLVVTPPRKVNLLDLTNGVLEELGQVPLPAGQYTQLRLVLRGNAGGAPANSVVPTGGSEQPLDTPSAVQSGIKLIHPFTVAAGDLADVVLDFDACKSIVRRGNGTFGLKPVIAVLPRVVAEIVGNVDPALTDTTVTAQVGGNIVRATTPDATGAFKLAYLNPAAFATVDVVITAKDRATAVVTGVPIALQSSTRISTAAEPIALPASATRTASGDVTPAAAAPSVRAVQAVGAVPKIEVGAVNADAAGAYALTLPTAAPRLASYATPLPLAFSTQAANAAKYTLEASADGYLTQSAAVDLSAANATVDFTLPPAP
ncbi:MAG TPA: DUF4382 domain-containing protein [Burkholderiaceae bacterium]|nr:DUF4382 domain-containing protein [Burkholderiaceae bacterium]